MSKDSKDMEFWQGEYKVADQGSGVHSDISGTDLPYKNMGTVEPRWTDEGHPIVGGRINDTPLAFIYGAIKKYGNDPQYFDDLKIYIRMMVEEIGNPYCQ